MYNTAALIWNTQNLPHFRLLCDLISVIETGNIWVNFCTNCVMYWMREFLDEYTAYWQASDSAAQMVKEWRKEQIKPDVLNSLKFSSVLYSVTGLNWYVLKLTCSVKCAVDAGQR